MSRPKIRKVNAGRRKKRRKDSQKQLAERASLMMNHPKECCACGRGFERTKETVKTWQVTVVEERVHLTCAKCWDIISAAHQAVLSPEETHEDR